jgi:hypothetical protein
VNLLDPGSMRSLEVQQLLEVCASALWARQVAAGGPYSDVDALLEQADRVLASLPDAEIDAALAGHPRIGGRIDSVLDPTHDRVMATSLVAQWRFSTAELDWDAVYTGVKEELVKQFAVVHSLALQQTLYEMGKAVLERYPAIAEVRLSTPNKHHFRYDLSRFGLENNNEVFHADDRPYGLIQATVTRDDAPEPGPAWDGQFGWLA